MARRTIRFNTSSRLAAFLLLFLFVFAISTPASAVNGTLNQKVFPLNCVFETVNDGLGTIVYLTPDECGVIITPTNPDPDSNPVNPNIPSNPPTTPLPSEQPQATIIQTGEGVIYQLPIIAPNTYSLQYTGVGENIQDLPYSPVAAIQDTQADSLEQAATTSVLANTVVISALVTLLLIVLFILL